MKDLLELLFGKPKPPKLDLPETFKADDWIYKRESPEGNVFRPYQKITTAVG